MHKNSFENTKLKLIQKIDGQQQSDEGNNCVCFEGNLRRGYCVLTDFTS